MYILIFTYSKTSFAHYLMCIFQAENLIQQAGDEAVKSIKKDFGTNKDLTGLWNSTMTTVCVTFIDEMIAVFVL